MLLDIDDVFLQNRKKNLYVIFPHSFKCSVSFRVDTCKCFCWSGLYHMLIWPHFKVQILFICLSNYLPVFCNWSGQPIRIALWQCHGSCVYSTYTSHSAMIKILPMIWTFCAAQKVVINLSTPRSTRGFHGLLCLRREVLIAMVLENVGKGIWATWLMNFLHD